MNTVKTLLFSSILVAIYAGNVNAEQVEHCSMSYKTCISNLLDHYDAYSNAYDKYPADCRNNLKE